MTASAQLSSKIRERMGRPRHRGGFDAADASARGLVLSKVKVQTATVTALFDPDTRVLYDARFFTYGAPVGIAILDAWVELAKGLALEEVRAIGPEDVERFLRDDPDVEATDPGGRCFFGIVADLAGALEANWPSALAAAEAERTIRERRLAGGSSAAEELTRQAADFLALTPGEQRGRIEEVLDEHVRPGLAADGGGIVVEDLKDGREVVVTYQGTCGSCGISSGATLGFIEQALRSRVHDEIRVVPTNATTWAI